MMVIPTADAISERRENTRHSGNGRATHAQFRSVHDVSNRVRSASRWEARFAVATFDESAVESRGDRSASVSEAANASQRGLSPGNGADG